MTDCRHGNQTLRFKINAACQKMFVWQCSDCGRKVGSWVKRSEIDESTATAFDEQAWDAAISRDSEEWSRRWQENRADMQLQQKFRNAQWRAKYEMHLRSEKWRDICRRVKERDDGLCQGCRLRPGAHVHHLTYERMGDEMLFDLVLVCRGCHERIHPHMASEAAE